MTAPAPGPAPGHDAAAAIPVSQRQARLARLLLSEWRERGLLEAEQAARLAASLRTERVDWRGLAQLAIVLAAICLAAAVVVLVSSDLVTALIERLFAASDAAKAAALAVLSAILYGAALRSRRRWLRRRFTNEGLLLLGVLTTAAALGFGLRALPTERDVLVAPALLAVALLYAVIALAARAPSVWVAALVAAGAAFGSATGHASGWAAHYAGMSHPLRFVLFGGLLVAAAFAVREWRAARLFVRPSAAVGLLCLFVALWILSLHGNAGFDDPSGGLASRLSWSVVLGLATLACWAYGWRRDDAMARGFGATFVAVNLFTRYFEYLWDEVHKAVFFAVLGLALWGIGIWAQRRWAAGRRIAPEASVRSETPRP